MSRSAIAAALAVALTGGACASQPVVVSAPPPRADLVVVLPGRDGAVGEISVVHGPNRQVLKDAYAAARITDDGRAESARLGEPEVRTVFGAALGALPEPTTVFLLYFAFGTAQLTPESERALMDVLAEVKRRPDPEVVIIGHTDRKGPAARNDVLSLERAEYVRQLVIKLNVPSDKVQAVGRGEREPLVPTEDEVEEPRNRRVEVTVR